jgi:hypothetical protein
MTRDPIDLQSPSYTPERLLGEVMFVARAKNRNKLAHALEVDPGLISRIWNKLAPVSDYVFMQIADRTGWSVQYMRELAGIPYDGAVYPPRVRVAHIKLAPRNYHLAKGHILQAMPGTVGQLAKKSGYSRGTVEIWLKVLRAGDPMTRGSHIVEWIPPAGAGAHAAVHQAGPGEDAVRIPRGRVRERRRRLLGELVSRFLDFFVRASGKIPAHIYSMA